MLSDIVRKPFFIFTVRIDGELFARTGRVNVYKFAGFLFFSKLHPHISFAVKAFYIVLLPLDIWMKISVGLAVFAWRSIGPLTGKTKRA